MGQSRTWLWILPAIVSLASRVFIASPTSNFIMNPSSSLPLDWTRVSRKRSADDDAADCCVGGGVCRHRRRATRVPIPTTTTTTTDDKVTHYQGKVIVCLLDSNPDWFQAYLFLQDSSETWGLLGIQKEIDECLQCSEGGYRVIDLQVTSKDKVTLRDIEWTGGDMVDLKGSHVTMQADKIMTGSDAVPVLEGIFSGILAKVRAETPPDDHVDPLRLFPELAIVVGKMEIRLPEPV